MDEEISSSTQESLETELAVIESIFPSELENLSEPGAKHLDIRLTIKPCDAPVSLGEDSTHVIIRITTTEGYPAVPANYDVEWSEGLGKNVAKQMQEGLDDLRHQYAEKKKSMIIDMGFYILNFLSEHCQMDEKKKETLAEEDGVERENRFKEAQERTLKVLKEETRQRKESYKIQKNDPSGLLRNYRKGSVRTVSESSDTIMSHSVSCQISGRQRSVHILSQFAKRQSQPCYIYLSRIDDNDDFVLCYKWSIQIKNSYKLQDLERKLKTAHSELESLSLFPNDNLIPFMGMAYDVRPSHVSIHLVQEYIGQGVSLQYFLNNNIPLNEAFLRLVGADVLQALNFLHSKDKVHRNLRDSCLYIDANSNRIRLADSVVELRCTEAVMDCLGIPVCFAYPRSPGKSGKKADVYRFGLVMLSLSQGYRVSQATPPIPDSLGSAFSNFLSKCLEVNELHRWTADKLLKHRFIDPDCQENSQEDQNSTVDENDILEESVVSSVSAKRTGNSRFAEEYEVIDVIGKGGFGSVFKVRHKMVGKLYALKMIELNPKKSQWEKMTAEVRLLSSLNHENVVRYYTSWVEVNEDNIPELGEFSETSESSQVVEVSTGGDTELAALGAPDDWITNFQSYSPEEDDSIVFEDSQSGIEQTTEEESTVTDRPTHTPNVRRLSHLYIQMDLCENKTLRQAIDQGLHLDEQRQWRLFRELINGIDYIHGRRLIHRDLKPGNIFLDSEDHVKIGDFGLAKMDPKAQVPTKPFMQEFSEPSDQDNNTMTSEVGTTFYIAPEVCSSLHKVYTRKIDMYSLGIIFFEMLYYFNTQQERGVVLTNIRKHPPVLPSNTDELITKDKKEIILKLLVHDPSERPSATELLQSQLLPPPTEEHTKFVTTLKDTLNNVRSANFNELLDLIFQRSSRPELEASFYLAQTKSKARYIWLMDYLRCRVTSIFRAHGGVCIPTPFFTPKNSAYESKDSVPHFMSQGGELLCSQYELHYPFARWLALKDIKRIRRYNIDRVQREFKTLGVHPSEFYQCAFDIVDRKSEFSEVTARILMVAQDILQKVTKFDCEEITLQICHQKLTRMILSHCRVQNSLHDEVIKLLKTDHSSEETQKLLRNLLKANRFSYNALTEFFDMKGSLEDVFSQLRARFDAVKGEKENKQCLEFVEKELLAVTKTARLMGFKLNVLFDPLVVLDFKFFSGISFQLFREEFPKNRPFILAVGGAYEDVVCKYKNGILDNSKANDLGICVVGFSVSLLHLVTHLKEQKNLMDIVESSDQTSSGLENLTQVFICAVDERQLEERIRLADDLRERGIRADHGYFPSRVEADEAIHDLWFLPYVVYMEFEEDTVLIKSGPKTTGNLKNVVGRRVGHSQIVEYLCKLLQRGPQAPPDKAPIRKEMFRSSSVQNSIHVEFITKKVLKDKDEKTQRMRVEEAFNSSQRYSGLLVTHSVEILVVDIDRKDMLTIGILDVDSTLKNFNESVLELKIKFSTMKDYIEKLCNHIRKRIFQKQKKNDKPIVILLYSISSETFKRI